MLSFKTLGFFSWTVKNYQIVMFLPIQKSELLLEFRRVSYKFDYLS